YHEIAEKISQFKVPVLIIYGEEDKILPQVAKTMNRVKEDLPQSEIHILSNCGHFLQEEEPEEIGRIINEFMSRN
ncbi:MAG: pimeloyl-ACP methyl ester carboxylesterase, partial [Saprospiraceae bacterium]